ncbi:hypothetical protein [Sphingomonas sp. PAMC 26621]|uniref:hypothetical protein n=1 Tax=Sphingomonas sp. PAMC 26621 TaxID=1112213 RepID=UPI000287B8F0|nr:hypothetical protein [Sphingomonas sp. PAMC 26621]
MANIDFGIGLDTSTGDLFPDAVAKLGLRVDALAIAVMPTPTLAKLIANPQPAEPDPTVPNSTRGWDLLDAHKIDHYVEVNLQNFNNVSYYLGMTADGQNGCRVDINNNHLIGYNVVNGVDTNTGDYYAFDSSFSVPGTTFHFEFTLANRMRLYAKRAADLDFTLLSGFTARMNKPVGTYTKTALSNAPSGTLINSAKAGPIGSATNPLVASNAQFLLASKTVRATVKYYIPVADTLMAQIEDSAGNVLIAALPVKVISNDTAGTAVVETNCSAMDNMLGSDFNVRFVFQNYPTVRGAIATNYPTKSSWGSNVQPATDYQTNRSAFTNLGFSGHWQDTFNGYARRNAIDDPAFLDADGMPLKSGLVMQTGFAPANPGQVVHMEMTWTGGPINLWIRPLEGSWTFSNQVNVNANTIHWDVVRDHNDPAEANAIQSLVLQSIDETNPPKNLSIHVVGADLTKRFDPNYLAFVSELDGPMRFLDWGQALDPYGYNTKRGWAKRTRRSVLGKGPRGLAYEDMLELSQLTGRDVWLCLPSSMPSSPEGLDELFRVAQMMDTGAGAEGVTGGIPAQCKIHMELGDENWSAGNPNYFWQADVGRPFVPTYGDTQSDADRAARHGSMLAGRLISQKIFGQKIRDAVPTWQSRVINELNVQMGTSDLGNLLGQGQFWIDALPYVDAICKAPYLPNDPNVSQSATPPASYSPTDVVAYLDAALNDKIISFAQDRQQVKSTGKPLNIYEWNISRVSFPRTKEDEFIWLTSPEFFAFMRDRFMPFIASVGGATCVYSDTGCYNNGQAWDVDTGPGSAANALIDGMRAYLGKPTSRNYAHGPAALTAGVLSGNAAGSAFTITPPTWPAGTQVITRAIVGNGSNWRKITGTASDRQGFVGGNTIEYVEFVKLGDGFTFQHSNKITLT